MNKVVNKGTSPPKSTRAVYLSYWFALMWDRKSTINSYWPFTRNGNWNKRFMSSCLCKKKYYFNLISGETIYRNGDYVGWEFLSVTKQNKIVEFKSNILLLIKKWKLTTYNLLNYDLVILCHWFPNCLIDSTSSCFFMLDCQFNKK